jgi:hypothetical protein
MTDPALFRVGTMVAALGLAAWPSIIAGQESQPAS